MVLFRKTERERGGEGRKSPPGASEPKRNDNDLLMIVCLSTKFDSSRAWKRLCLTDRKYKRLGDGTIGISRGSSNIVSTDIHRGADRAERQPASQPVSQQVARRFKNTASYIIGFSTQMFESALNCARQVISMSVWPSR